MSWKKAVLLQASKIAPGVWSKRLRNPVFILGCARSGTSLLDTLLGDHRDFARLSEANDVWDPSGYPWYRSALQTPPVWVDPAAYTARWWRENEPRQREIRAYFGLYQSIRRTPFFLNKSPFNTFRIPQLLQMFPDARFVYIVRDGRAVVRSYTQKVYDKIAETPEPYGKFGIGSSRDEVSVQIAKYWKMSIDEVAKQDAALGLKASGLMLEISYESLCSEVKDTLAIICQHLGLDANRFKPTGRIEQVRSRNYKWKGEFGEQVKQQISAILESELVARGYEVGSAGGLDG